MANGMRRSHLGGFKTMPYFPRCQIYAGTKGFVKLFFSSLQTKWQPEELLDALIGQTKQRFDELPAQAAVLQLHGLCFI